MGDTSAQLVTGTVAAVLAGVLALAYPTRLTTLIAAAVSVVPATDIGPVLHSDGEGAYGPGTYVALVAGIVLGATWLVEAAARAPQRPLSGVWLLMPVFGAATLAGATLPWAVVSEVGATSGARSAWQLLLGGEPNIPPGYLMTRLVAIGVVLLVAGGITAALLFAQRAAALAAAAACGLAAATTLGLQLWLALGDDAVAPADGAPGIRIAVVGFAALALLWLAQAPRRKVSTAPADQPTAANLATSDPSPPPDDGRTAKLAEPLAPADAATAADTSEPVARLMLQPVRHTIPGTVQRQIHRSPARPSTPVRR